MLSDDVYTTCQSVVSGRLYPDEPAQDPTLPFGIFTMIGGGPEWTMGGQTNLTNARYQIDLFATTRRSVNTLADSVISAMNNASLFKAVCELRQEGFESEVKWYRTTLGFSIWK